MNIFYKIIAIISGSTQPASGAAIIKDVQTRRLFLGLLAPAAGWSADLREPTERFYETYIGNLVRRLASRPSFLLIDSAGGLRARVKGGELFVEERRARREPPDGLIHHWEGAVFVPKVKLADVLRFVQDYDSHKKVYGPEVVASQILQKNGNDFLVRLRLLKKQILTVVLETEHKVSYKQVDDTKWESISRSTKVSEVDDPDKPKEKQLPQGTGNGFVWKMDSLWRFMEADGGVYLECTSVSLSRDVPFGMGRIIRPIIEELPADSLRNVLTKTRQALRR